MTSRPLRVLRIYHSAVVSGFRERDRHLRQLGVDETLVTPLRWNEGGEVVTCVLHRDEEASTVRARTLGRHPFLFLYSPVALTRAWRRSNPQILDVHEEPASLAVGEMLLLRAALRSSIPVTLYSAQNILKRYPAPFRWIERWALRTASAVYCCNEAAAEVVRTKGFRGSTHVIGLGVDATHFAPQRPPSVAPLTNLGYVGRLEHHKGVHVLIAAMSQLPESLTLTIVGAGPASSDLKAQVCDLGLHDRVFFRPFVAHGDLPTIYDQFDAVVLPSVPTPGLTEQFGRVAVEAMSMAIPVVASKVGALPEVVGPGGLLVEPDDPTALAEALQWLSDDQSRRAELSASAYEWAQRFDWGPIAQQHFALYEAVVRGH